MARVLIQILLFLVATYSCGTGAQERSLAATDGRTSSLEERILEARAKSKQLSQTDRDAVLALFASAFQVYRANNHAAARIGFEDGLERDPANGIAQFYLAEVLTQLGETRLARRRYEMAAALIPSSPEGLLARAALAKLAESQSGSPSPNQSSAAIQAMAPELPAVNPLAAQELTNRHGCVTCHAIDQKLVGPAFRDVARRYSGNSNAFQLLVEKVRKGGSGNFGAVPMPPNPNPQTPEIMAIVAWVLSLR